MPENFTDFLQEFGDVNLTEAETLEQKSMESSAPLEELETIDFDNGLITTDNPVKIEEPNQTVTKEDFEGFDKVCVGAAEFTDKASSVASSAKVSLGIVANKCLSTFTINKNLHVFQKGKMVIYNDFVFLMRDNQLLLLKYRGHDSQVIIPDSVGGIPVTFIHDTAFKRGKFSATVKLKNIVHALRKDEASIFTIDSIINAAKGITKIQLPIGLKFIPNHVLKYCKGVTALEIPEAVTSIAPNAFKGSNLENLAFSGPCAKNLKYVAIDNKVTIYLKKTYLETYEGVLL